MPKSVSHPTHTVIQRTEPRYWTPARGPRSGLGGVVESSDVLRTLATTAPCDACRGVRKLTGFAEDQHPAPTSRAPHCARASIQASAPLAATGLHSTRRTSKFGRRSLVMVNQVIEIKPRRSRRRRDGRSRHARAPTSPATAPGDRRRSAPSLPDAQPYPLSFGARHRSQPRLRR